MVFAHTHTFCCGEVGDTLAFVRASSNSLHHDIDHFFSSLIQQLQDRKKSLISESQLYHNARLLQPLTNYRKSLAVLRGAARETHQRAADGLLNGRVAGNPARLWRLLEELEAARRTLQEGQGTRRWIW